MVSAVPLAPDAPAHAGWQHDHERGHARLAELAAGRARGHRWADGRRACGPASSLDSDSRISISTACGARRRGRERERGTRTRTHEVEGRDDVPRVRAARAQGSVEHPRPHDNMLHDRKTASTGAVAAAAPGVVAATGACSVIGVALSAAGFGRRRVSAAGIIGEVTHRETSPSPPPPPPPTAPPTSPPPPPPTSPSPRSPQPSPPTRP